MKYHNTPTNGSASKLEAERKRDLELMERAGLITDLRCQVPYILIPAQYIDGKCVEKSCKYVADFVYRKDGELVVEETKGFKTKDYIIKRKLMLHIYGIRIREICDDKNKKGGRRYKRQTMARKGARN